MKLLHFADAHIDMANFGRHDPQTGLPVRVLDFLKSLDTIVDTAIAEKVDLVIFAGDAYKDRSPAPTFQREWGRRIMRLSQAGIPIILLVGNHDVSPSIGRAHTLQEFDTLAVPLVHVIARPTLLGPAELGIPAQVIGLPWVSRSGLMASLANDETTQVFDEIESLLSAQLREFIAQADPALPLILTAHASVQGATFGGERMVMLGNDLVLSGEMVKNPRLDYVALGHIHKPQELNLGQHPPVIYPGSIERVDFGEARDEKFFIVAEVAPGKTTADWRRLNLRPFVDCFLRLEDSQNVSARLLDALPPADQLNGAIVRLVVEYPRDLETLIDEAALREHTKAALEFQLVKRPQVDARARLASSENIASLTPLELLDIYWASTHTDPAEAAALQTLAAEMFRPGEDEKP
ncbi:MAG: exonuclease SbcCD subunit D [Anaerolineales bacterium]